MCSVTHETGTLSPPTPECGSPWRVRTQDTPRSKAQRAGGSAGLTAHLPQVGPVLRPVPSVVSIVLVVEWISRTTGHFCCRMLRASAQHDREEAGRRPAWRLRLAPGDEGNTAGPMHSC